LEEEEMQNQNVKKQAKLTNLSLVNSIYSESIAKKFDLDLKSLVVLIGLASHYNDDKKIVFPSQEYLAEHLNISERSVIRSIKELLSKGLIIKSKNGLNNIYCFTNIFFEAVKLSSNTCQVVTQKGDQLSLKHDKSNKIKNSKILNFKKDGVNYQKADDILEQIEKDKQESSSPLDFNREQAIEYLNDLPVFLKNSFFAIELRKKFNL
jgi:DNA-binding MarR family transcriptional regulator